MTLHSFIIICQRFFFFSFSFSVRCHDVVHPSLPVYTEYFNFMFAFKLAHSIFPLHFMMYTFTLHFHSKQFLCIRVTFNDLYFMRAPTEKMRFQVNRPPKPGMNEMLCEIPVVCEAFLWLFRFELMTNTIEMH